MNYLSTVGVLVVDHLAIYKAYKVNCVQVPVFFAVVAVLAVNFVFAVLSVFAFLNNVPIVVVNVVLFRCGDCFRPGVTAVAGASSQTFFCMSRLFYRFSLVIGMLLKNCFATNVAHLLVVLIVVFFPIAKFVTSVAFKFQFVLDVPLGVCRHVQVALFAVAVSNLYAICKFRIVGIFKYWVVVATCKYQHCKVLIRDDGAFCRSPMLEHSARLVC